MVQRFIVFCSLCSCFAVAAACCCCCRHASARVSSSGLHCNVTSFRCCCCATPVLSLLLILSCFAVLFPNKCVHHSRIGRGGAAQGTPLMGCPPRHCFPKHDELDVLGTHTVAQHTWCTASLWVAWEILILSLTPARPPPAVKHTDDAGLQCNGIQSGGFLKDPPGQGVQPPAGKKVAGWK